MTPSAALAARRPFRDNPRLILAGIVVLVGVLVALIAIVIIVAVAALGTNLRDLFQTAANSV